MIKWRKASKSTSEGGACVELAQLHGAELHSAVGMRDSKDTQGPAIALSQEAFRILVRDVKSGALDVP